MRKDTGTMTLVGESVKRLRIECNPYFLDNALDWLKREGYTIHGYGDKYLGNDKFDSSVTVVTAYKMNRIDEQVICAKAFMPCSCDKCRDD